MALTELSKVREFLQMAEAVVKHDALLNRLIGYVSARSRNFMGGRDLEHQTLTGAQFDGSGRPFLRVDHYPITAITDIRIDTDQVFGSETALTLANDIRRSPRYDKAGMIYRAGGIQTNWASTGSVSAVGSVWPRGIGNIQIDYAGGFQNIPEDVEEAIAETVAEFFQKTLQLRTGQSGAPIMSEAIGRDQSTTYQKQWDRWSFPGTARYVLAGYKHTL